MSTKAKKSNKPAAAAAKPAAAKLAAAKPSAKASKSASPAAAAEAPKKAKRNAKKPAEVVDEKDWSDDEHAEAYNTQTGEDDEAALSSDDEAAGEAEEAEENQEEGEDDSEGEEFEDDSDESDAEPMNDVLASVGPAELAKMMAMITNMKKEEGPKVRCVHLQATGNTGGPMVDMTPRLNGIVALLKGKVTFVGQYGAPLSAAVMMLKDQAESLPVNKHVLPPPYDRDAGVIRGDMLVVRMDDDATPTDLTVKEWNAFVKAGGAPAAAAASPSAAKGKKQGMSTEQAAAKSKQKRKSTGGEEADDEGEEAAEAETEQPAKKKQKQAASAVADEKKQTKTAAKKQKKLQQKK